MAKKKTDTPRSFTHDSNARNSAGIIRLRLAHGAAGYGIFFMLLERLRDSPDYIADIDYEVLAYDLRESPELIRSVIEDFGLFELTDDSSRFFSPTLKRRLDSQYCKKETPKDETPTVVEPAAATETNTAEPAQPIREEAPAPQADVAEPTICPDLSPEQLRDVLIDQACADSEWLRGESEELDRSVADLILTLRTDFLTYCNIHSVTFNSLSALKSHFSRWV